ncbi:LysM peptidoglycan-binding domain-containing protein [Actinomyces sp. oral taxon 414]|uniref:LysM peptidoglycan-binding domain-containing protein n=1 Tax=Actinomyces sp. oral taxon 414 TaxID=712122 RepID=UPI000B2F90A9|nr:hypothetical protein [Actinomyces sp. oral taxon 414]
MAPRSSAAALGPQRFRAPTASERSSAWRSAGAGLALLAVVLGMPALLLLTLGPPPIPSGLSLAVLTGAVSVNALLGVLIWVLWLAWLQFTVCAAVEAVSALRGNGLPRHVPLSGGMQTLARRLVIAALLVTTAASPATAAPVVLAPASEPVAAVQAEDGAQADQSPQAAQTAQEDDAAVAGEAAQEAGDVTYRLGDAVLDPEVGAQLVGRRVYVVQPPQGHYHDNLWDIAERSLGDGRAYQQIYDLNAGRVQPDGRALELARLIQPNWYLIMPEEAADIPRVEAVSPAPAPDTPTPAPAPARQTAATGADGLTGGSATTAAERMADVAPTQAPALGALTGAAVLSLLVRRRRYGSWLLPRPDAGELERLLRIGADPDRAERLDTALRSLSALSAPPAPYAAGVDDEAVTLFLSRPMPQAPQPWRARREGWIWALARDAVITAPDEPARVGTGLVTLGRDERGTDVLIDLSLVDGDVAVNGAPSMAAEVIAALALELCINPWSARIRVTGVGLPQTLHELCGRRLERADDLAAALGAPEPADVLTGRRRRSGPRRVVLATGQQEAVSPHSRETVLVRTGGGARWRIEVDTAGTARVEPLGVGVRVTRATEHDLACLRELFASERSSGRPDAPDPPRPPVTTAALRSAPVRVQVLGPATVMAPGAVEPERLPLLTEAVACLALNRDGLHPRVLASMIWPLGVTGDVVTASIERLRVWLGDDETGATRLREDEEGRLVLGPDVVVDWDVLRALAAAARRSPRAEELRLLQEALRLVRGRVCEGAEPGRYAWLARLRTAHDSEALITDSALRVAALLGRDDPEGAAAAIAVGLGVVELDQRLWQADLRLAAMRGHERLTERVGALLDTAGADDLRHVSPGTAALVEDLAPGRGLGVRRREVG